MPASLQAILYRNTRYGFTLRIPRWWRPYYTLSNSKYDPSSEAEIHFIFNYGGKRYDDIFSLLVYRMTHKDWIREGYEDSPLVFLAESRGRVFAYLTPGELPNAFLKPDGSDYDYARYGRPIRILKRMVNRDVPDLVHTLRFTQARAARTAFPPAPYLSRQVCSCSRRQ